MRYAIAAILLVYGLICLVWPGRTLQFLQGGWSRTVSEGYWSGSILALRVIGLLILIGVPGIFLLGYVR